MSNKVESHFKKYNIAYLLVGVSSFGILNAVLSLTSLNNGSHLVSNVLLKVFKEDRSYIAGTVSPMIDNLNSSWGGFLITTSLFVAGSVFFSMYYYYNNKVEKISTKAEDSNVTIKKATNQKINTLKNDFVIPLRMIEESTAFNSCIVDHKDIIKWSSKSFVKTMGIKNVIGLPFGSVLKSNKVFNTSNMTKESGSIQLRDGSNLIVNSNIVFVKGLPYRFIEMLPSNKEHVEHLPKAWNINEDIKEVLDSLNLLNTKVEASFNKSEKIFSILPQDLVIDSITKAMGDIYLYSSNHKIRDISVSLEQKNKHIKLLVSLKDHKISEDLLSKYIVNQNVNVNSLKTTFKVIERKLNKIGMRVSVLNKIVNFENDTCLEFNFKNKIVEQRKENKPLLRRNNEYSI